MTDEGYIKFKCTWEEREPINFNIEKLNKYRDILHKMKLIGEYEKLGIGFGNISCRNPKNKDQFVISGTRTGGYKKLDIRHYSLVTSCNIRENTVNCVGFVEASSESMTHSVLYRLSEANNAVIHIHNLNMWERLQYLIPTTTKSISYGTSEMAEQVRELYETTELKNDRILAMAGHPEGLIAFGETLKEAMDSILKFYMICS